MRSCRRSGAQLGRGGPTERRAQGEDERPCARAGTAQPADRTTQDMRKARGRWETKKHSKQGGHPKQHGRQRRAGGTGTGSPSMVSRQLC